MIKLLNLEKSVKTKAGFTYLLRQINLDIAEGEFVTIMGPSGAGKSTLLSIIGFYDSAWEGEYYLFDQAVHKLAPKERAALNKRHVGFVFQQFHLLEDLTVAENLDIPLSYRNIKKSEREAIVDGERRYTYRQLDDAVHAFARGLMSIGSGVEGVRHEIVFR